MVRSLAQQDMASPGPVPDAYTHHAAQSQVVAQSSIDPTAERAFHTMINPSPNHDVWMQQQASTILQPNFQPKPMLAPWYQPHEAIEPTFTNQTATTTQQNSTTQLSQSIQPTSTIQPTPTIQATLSQPVQPLMQPTGQMEVSDLSQTTIPSNLQNLNNQDIMDTSEDLDIFASLGIQVNFGEGSKQISPPADGTLYAKICPLKWHQITLK